MPQKEHDMDYAHILFNNFALQITLFPMYGVWLCFSFTKARSWIQSGIRTANPKRNKMFKFKL